MTRSTDFSATVSLGVRSRQPDLVVHARRDPGLRDGPRIGFVVSKAVGGAVDRHRVARRLRHAVRPLIEQLAPADRIVVRALPGSRDVPSLRLQQELAAGVRRSLDLLEHR